MLMPCVEELRSGVVAAVGCSAGGLLALQLLKHCDTVKLAAVVSPAPLAQADWQHLHEVSVPNGKQAVMFWTKVDAARERMQNLSGPNVHCVELDKGHVGMVGAGLWQQILAKLKTLSDAGGSAQRRRPGTIVRIYEEGPEGVPGGEVQDESRRGLGISQR